MSTAENPDRFAERDVVFNVTWTGDVYEQLRYFVASLFVHTEARFRYLLNACTPDSVVAINEFASRHPDRVVEVLEVSGPERMIGHGDALDIVLRDRDDGPLFALIDCDIKAGGPFLADALGALGPHGAITSGREVWIDDNTQPIGHLGVDGQYFFRADGFVYGSPHVAVYRRDVIVPVMEKWGVGLGTGSVDTVPPETWAHLMDEGFEYLAFDTGKVVNILLQLEGHTLVHREYDTLVHIGGLSHYLAPPAWDTPGEDGEPLWTTWKGMTPRHQVAKYAATMITALRSGEQAPEPPADVDDSMRTKLELVRREMVDMIENPGPV